ncbi:MAG: FecR domain-containing protein [Acidobacteriota bacterium]|nr:MAG: FecR domain-containing protein [Acidobacteriota bacterium]
MKRHDKDLEQTLDRAIREIRDTPVDDDRLKQAAERVRTRLAEPSRGSAATSQMAGDARAAEVIEGCLGFRALLPRYLTGELPQAQTVLLEDHLRECSGCRRSLDDARAAGRVQPTAAQSGPVGQHSGRGRWSRWAMAAAALMILGVGLFAFGPSLLGRVTTLGQVALVDGELFRVESGRLVPVSAGEQLSAWDWLRTAKGSGAIVALADGSRVELGERSQIALARGWRDSTIQLERGNIIVEASDQGSGHLYVRTADCRVAVTGTVFSVNNGTKGSRISVFEGQVLVDQAGDTTVLQPGDQLSTHPSVGTVPLAQEIAWSRNIDQHLMLVSELSELRRELARVEQPETRYSTRLLDLAPADTVIYGAIPNLSGTVQQSYQLIMERVRSRPALQAWWDEHLGSEGERVLAEVIERFRSYGELLGDEIVVGIPLKGLADDGGVLVMAETRSGSALIELARRDLAMLGQSAEESLPIRLLGPFADETLPVVRGADQLLLWVDEELVLASNDPQRIRLSLAALDGTVTSSFVGTPFHQRLASAYRDGAAWLAAADLATLFGPEGPASEGDRDALAQLGFTGMRHLLFERKQDRDQTTNRAVLTFSEARQGIASWLAEPAPMGALGFVSPEAHAVGAAVMKDPKAMMSELFSFIEQSDQNALAELRDFEKQEGLSLLDDVAAPLGGEMVIALDGPVLPSPTWKVVVELYNPERLQQTIDWAVAQINEHAAERGTLLTLESSPLRGFESHALQFTESNFSVHYAFVDGYFVAGPSRAVLDLALRQKQTGYDISSSPEFLARVPSGDEPNFSALMYQNLAPLLAPLVGRVAGEQSLTPQQQQMLHQIAADAPPSMLIANGYADRIEVATTSDGVFGNELGQILGWSSMLSVRELLDGRKSGMNSEEVDSR